MNKKIQSFLVLVIIFTIVTSANILGAQTMPSSWAEAEVNEAIAQNLVYLSLRNDYQKPIKRYEYVMLALSILEQSGIDSTIQQEYIFDDTLGHPYEKDILKAYYAGIISGYGNKMFKPNDNISRQEVASLVVKLINVIKGEKVAEINNIAYSDTASIGPWAKASIDYCYLNSILKGVGKDKNGLDIIKPLGTATREESIVLLYRLARVEKVVNDVPADNFTDIQNGIKDAEELVDESQLN